MVSQQEVSGVSNGRAWFYLTLWRGTPEDFTTSFTLDIAESETLAASIQTADHADALVAMLDTTEAEIAAWDAYSTHITKTTEVTWYVH